MRDRMVRDSNRFRVAPQTSDSLGTRQLWMERVEQVARVRVAVGERRQVPLRLDELQGGRVVSFAPHTDTFVADYRVRGRAAR